MKSDSVIYPNSRAISPFPTVFSTRLKNILPLHQIWNCSLQTISVLRSLKFLVWERVNMLIDSVWNRIHDCFMKAIMNAPIHIVQKFMLTTTPYNILSKLQGSFSHNHCGNDGGWWERNKPCFDPQKEIGVQIRDSLFSSPTHYWLNPFPHNDAFWRPWETSLLKTLWEKEKLLVTSNFSFSHSVFLPFGLLSAIFVKFEIVVCKLFQFGRV